MQAFVSFFKTLGATRIIAMGAVTLALMAFFAFLIVRATAPQLSPLFTDLSVEDSSAIVKDLERQGISYDLKNEGSVVLVPREQIPRLRMKLAEGGLPKGGGVGYEIFDKSDALGATSFVQNINHLRALEGELSRTIRNIDRVQQARVHLVLPERPLFSREKAEPSASIKQLSHAPHVVVRVNDALHETARNRLDEIARTRGFEGRLVVIAEPEIAAGDCKIEWADDGVVRDAAMTDRAIGNAIGRYLGARQTAAMPDLGNIESGDTP